MAGFVGGVFFGAAVRSGLAEPPIGEGIGTAPEKKPASTVRCKLAFSCGNVNVSSPMVCLNSRRSFFGGLAKIGSRRGIEDRLPNVSHESKAIGLRFWKGEVCPMPGRAMTQTWRCAPASKPRWEKAKRGHHAKGSSIDLRKSVTF